MPKIPNLVILNRPPLGTTLFFLPNWIICSSLTRLCKEYDKIGSKRQDLSWQLHDSNFSNQKFTCSFFFYPTPLRFPWTPIHGFFKAITVIKQELQASKICVWKRFIKRTEWHDIQCTTINPETLWLGSHWCNFRCDSSHTETQDNGKNIILYGVLSQQYKAARQAFGKGPVTFWCGCSTIFAHRL